MGVPRRPALAGLAAVVALALPAATNADHVDVTARVGAKLAKRVGTRSWRVDVPSSITCSGAAPATRPPTADRRDTPSACERVTRR